MTNVSRIALTQGQYALVDAEDYKELMLGPKWYARYCRSTKSYYAVRNVRGENGKRVTELMHQKVTGFQWGKVDHINFDTLDNRKVNLRNGVHNNRHRKIRKGGTSRYHGVSWHPSQKWMAKIRVNNVLIHVGSFEGTPEGELTAAKAYDAASSLYHGEYGTRNFP